MNQSTGQAFSTEKRSDGVVVIWIDVPGEAVNTLKEGFAEQISEILDHLESEKQARGIVFASKKKGNFIAGADIKMLERANTADEAIMLSKEGQQIMDRISHLSIPVVAAIHGSCLGGGLELALACHGRVASTDKKTELGLPEVQLGLLPGAGGTQRLPRLVGLQLALDMMLTGKRLRSNKALKVGLVDELVPEPIVVDIAAKHALRKGASSANKSKRRRSITQALLEGNPLGRSIVFDQAKKQVLSKTRGNYPAPLEIIRVVKAGLSQGMRKGLEAEAQAFGGLVISPEARQLMYLFFAQNETKKSNGVDDPSIKASKIGEIAMLGAGLMGAGITYVSANNAKVRVRLKDRDAEGIARGLQYVADILNERVKKKRMTKIERDTVLARITATVDYVGFDKIPLVIEAVFEDIGIKHRVLKDVEQRGKPDVIFASNTSSLPIAKIAEASVHPDTVIGMHYFSPVHKMPLLEIIVTEKTAPWVTATCVDVGKKQGKTVIVVNDGVGFYTSRILGPYMNEAAFLLSEGVSIEAIDKALVDFGFPVGPVTLLDEVGLDVADKVGKILFEEFGQRLKPPDNIMRLLQDDRLGKKNKKGFYNYSSSGQKDKQVDESVYAVMGIRGKSKLSPTEIADRVSLQMINEAMLCFGEGILRSAMDGDIGAVFGLGFPPFLGGPFRYVDSKGAAHVVEALKKLESVHGLRFKPAPVLEAMAAEKLSFHGSDVMQPGQHRNTR